MNRPGWLDGLRHLARRHPFLYRLRYALIVRFDGYDVRARPGSSSRALDTTAPKAFHDVVKRLGLGDGGDHRIGDARGMSFDDVRRLAFDLSHGHPRGPGLGVTSTEALQAIYCSPERGGAGVCSDYTQVFLGLCRAAGIPCREWGLTEAFDRRGVGHALTEVFVDVHEAKDRAAEDLEMAAPGRWVLLDPYLSVYATRRGDDAPLSMAEAIDLTTAGRRDEIEVRAIDDGAASLERRTGYVARYFVPQHRFFVLSNNRVFRQDDWIGRLGFLPLPLVHGAMLVCGVYQRFHLYTNDRNRAQMAAEAARLRRFRRALGVAGWLLLLAGAAFGGLAMARR